MITLDYTLTVGLSWLYLLIWVPPASLRVTSGYRVPLCCERSMVCYRLAPIAFLIRANSTSLDWTRSKFTKDPGFALQILQQYSLYWPGVLPNLIEEGRRERFPMSRKAVKICRIWLIIIPKERRREDNASMKAADRFAEITQIDWIALHRLFLTDVLSSSDPYSPAIHGELCMHMGYTLESARSFHFYLDHSSDLLASLYRLERLTKMFIFFHFLNREIKRRKKPISIYLFWCEWERGSLVGYWFCGLFSTALAVGFISFFWVFALMCDKKKNSSNDTGNHL